MPGPRYGSRYHTSKGVCLLNRGYWNPRPQHNYLSGDGRSHVYRGAGYYVPSEKVWKSYVEYHSLPSKSCRDAKLMESEDQWIKFARNRDKVHQASGISISTQPELYRRNPLPQLLPYKTKAWNRQWDGPGYFCPLTDTWIHEQGHTSSPGIPVAAYRFYNNEDWIKFKYMSEKPALHFTKSNINGNILTHK